MAWARVTSATAQSSANPTVSGSLFPAITLGAAVVVGDRIMVQTALFNNDSTTTTSSVTDQLGNVYSKDFSARIDSAVAEMAEWSAPVTTGGTPVITGHSSVNFVSGGECGIAAGAYRGLSTGTGAAAIDISKTTTGTAATADSGATAGTTTAANELKFGFYGDDGWATAIAAGAGYSLVISTGTSPAEQALLEDADSGASGSTAQATVGTAGSAWFCGVAVYKLAGAVAGDTQEWRGCSTDIRNRRSVNVSY